MGDLKFLYINGDSWTVPVYLNQYTDCRSPNYKNIFVINQSVGGCGNRDIIERTKLDLKILKEKGIVPSVCIALSEVGRNFKEEFELVKPNHERLNDYLRQVLLKEIEILETNLKDLNYYITTGWIPSPNSNKAIIDYIGIDKNDVEVYSYTNVIFEWLSVHQKIFKFTKESFIDAVENKQRWEYRLVNNPYIDDTLHVNPRNLTPYNNWLDDILRQLELI